MDTSTTHTSHIRKYSGERPTKAEIEKDRLENKRALAKKIGITAVTAAVGVGSLLGLKWVSELPTDASKTDLPIDSSIESITLSDNTDLLSHPGEADAVPNKGSDVVGTFESNTTDGSATVTIETPDGVRTEKVMDQSGAYVTYTGISLEDAKAAGIDIVGKDRDNIIWVDDASIKSTEQSQNGDQ